MDNLSEYEAYLITEKGASMNTLSSYLRDVLQFTHWLKGKGKGLEQAEQADVERYIRYLSGQGKSVATITRLLASLKSFYTYMLRQGRVSCPRFLPIKRLSFFWPSQIRMMQRAAGTGLCWNCSMPLEYG